MVAMIFPHLYPLAALALAGLLLSPAARAAALLRCQVSYAGSAQVIETAPVDDPYTVPSVDIGGRFRFKAVMVGAAGQPERISLYAYFNGRQQPVLIQQAKYLQPFRASVQPYALTGEQHLYAGPAERELIYSCTLQGVEP